MRLSVVKMPCLLLLLCGAATSWGSDFLYTPQPAAGESGEGVLVREVTVKKGDTLSRLSKQFSGRGYYYPQILLFNEIKNPNLIHPGQVVRVPLSRKAMKKHAESKRKNRHQGHVTTAATESASNTTVKPVVQAVAHNEKVAYDRALVAFQKGDCTAAIKLFDDFISHYPASTLLPEATLDRAECYLKLSKK